MTDMLKVQQALRFNSSDLAYNRRGEPSPAQKQMWRDAEQGCARYFLYISAAAAAAAVLAGVLIQDEVRVVIMIVGGVLAALALGGFLLMRSPTPGMDTIHSVTGQARLDIDRGEKNTRYYKLMIGKIDFTIAPELYQVLEQDAAYTAHYQQFGRTHRLVSLEKA